MLIHICTTDPPETRRIKPGASLCGVGLSGVTLEDGDFENERLFDYLRETIATRMMPASQYPNPMPIVRPMPDG